MSNGLTVLVLIGLIATIVLVVVVLIRQSGGFDTAAKTVRDELKAGREETQQAAARLREELGLCPRYCRLHEDRRRPRACARNLGWA